MGTKVPAKVTDQELEPDWSLPLIHKMIGGLSHCVGEVATGKNLISHQGKPVRITAGGLEDHVEGRAHRSGTVLEWSVELKVCEDAQGDDSLPSAGNVDSAVSREKQA